MINPKLKKFLKIVLLVIAAIIIIFIAFEIYLTQSAKNVAPYFSDDVAVYMEVNSLGETTTELFNSSPFQQLGKLAGDSDSPIPLINPDLTEKAGKFLEKLEGNFLFRWAANRRYSLFMLCDENNKICKENFVGHIKAGFLVRTFEPLVRKLAGGEKVKHNGNTYYKISWKERNFIYHVKGGHLFVSNREEAMQKLLPDKIEKKAQKRENKNIAKFHSKYRKNDMVFFINPEGMKKMDDPSRLICGLNFTTGTLTVKGFLDRKSNPDKEKKKPPKGKKSIITSVPENIQAFWWHRGWDASAWWNSVEARIPGDCEPFDLTGLAMGEAKFNPNQLLCDMKNIAGSGFERTILPYLDGSFMLSFDGIRRKPLMYMPRLSLSVGISEQERVRTAAEPLIGNLFSNYSGLPVPDLSITSYKTYKTIEERCWIFPTSVTYGTTGKFWTLSLDQESFMNLEGPKNKNSEAGKFLEGLNKNALGVVFIDISAVCDELVRTIDWVREERGETSERLDPWRPFIEFVSENINYLAVTYEPRDNDIVIEGSLKLKNM